MSTGVCAITGASGYVGSVLRRALQADDWQVIPLLRNPKGEPGEIRWHFESADDISSSLAEVRTDTLIHAAWNFAGSAAEQERINVQGSRRLFEQAQKAGVRRIVFISTISAFVGCKSLYGQSKLRVEELAQSFNGIVVRPGLVYGATPGGVFGAMRANLKKSSIVPCIGSGKYPQFLVHENDLAAAIGRACSNQWSFQPDQPVTVAHPRVWLFEDLIKEIGKIENKKVQLVKVPWRLAYAGIKFLESVHAPIPFRSDSVLSLVNQNDKPDWTPMQQLQIAVRPFPENVN